MKNSIKILEGLILDTSEGKINWVNTYGYSKAYHTYRFTLNLTKNKNIEFNIFVYGKKLSYSYMKIYFVQNQDKNKKQFIETINASTEFLLYDLIELVAKNKTEI